MELKVREHCSRSVVSVNILVFFLADWHFVIAGCFSFWSNKICYRFSNISGSWWSSWTWFCIYRYNIGISHEGWFSLLYQCQSYLSLDLFMTGQNASSWTSIMNKNPVHTICWQLFVYLMFFLILIYVICQWLSFSNYVVW